MSKVLTFQEAIMRLESFWAGKGCLIWQPYNVQVGAGTMNPATTLRVLGPEPWNVAYVEPSIRPDDSRYGQNPNRMQQHYQYQVILKPDPGNPQEIYLESLEALGIDPRQHDIRFVEDNWESPALGAWGLGWEVWLDGQEITQFTYFQQAGGLDLDPVAVEITYGLERIMMALQGVRSFTEIIWAEGITYGDILLQAEIEHSKYNLDYADVELLTRLFNAYEQEASQCLERGLVIPAYDYILKCSHTFNVLDARGAIGVTERARYFARMRDLARQVALAYVKQREELGFPFLKLSAISYQRSAISNTRYAIRDVRYAMCDFLLEIGTEELPVGDLDSALEQLREKVPAFLEELRLAFESFRVEGTPRRLLVYVKKLSARQAEKEEQIKGPPVQAAYDREGRPTKSAEGFARKYGVRVEDLVVRESEGRDYVFAVKKEPGRSATEVLAEALPTLILGLRFPLTMRWNYTNVTFSRPIRWLVALLGEEVVGFECAGVRSGRVTRGLRPMGSPEINLQKAEDYFPAMAEGGIVVDVAERQAEIEKQIERLAAEVGGRIPEDLALVKEVTNLVESPTALRGAFEERFLELPQEVLITVMKKHQRYFPVMNEGGRLLPYFIAVRNGDNQYVDIVRAGNEEVLRARFADAVFFYEADVKKKLEDFLPRLQTLTFQEDLGSMLDKTKRLEELTPALAERLGLSPEEVEMSRRAAHLCKTDLASEMVVELTSLQGVMGRQYALLSGESEGVAKAIFEHYLPRFAGDALPESGPGIVLSLADRLDSLVGLFGVGLSPTGAADPYGLRRAALGLVQTLAERKLNFDLRFGLERAAAIQPIPVEKEHLDEVFDFIVQRMRGWLRERGYRHDVIEAILAERSHDPYLATESVAELSAWVEREEWPEILHAYARCARIVRPYPERFPLDPTLFVEKATERLHKAYLACRVKVKSTGSLDEFFHAFQPMIEPINTFFDEVLVMAEDQTLRENRLALLQRIAALTKGLADLSRLEGF